MYKRDVSCINAENSASQIRPLNKKTPKCCKIFICGNNKFFERFKYSGALSSLHVIKIMQMKEKAGNN